MRGSSETQPSPYVRPAGGGYRWLASMPKGMRPSIAVLGSSEADAREKFSAAIAKWAVLAVSPAATDGRSEADT